MVRQYPAKDTHGKIRRRARNTCLKISHMCRVGKAAVVKLSTRITQMAANPPGLGMLLEGSFPRSQR